LIEAQASSKEFNQNYKALKTWMKARKVKGNHQKMVMTAYSHKFKDSTTFDEEELLGQLPPEMQSNLIDKLYGRFIREIPYFRKLDGAILLQLTSKVKPLNVKKETAIMQEGQVRSQATQKVYGRTCFF